jgi:hypothetical protein
MSLSSDPNRTESVLRLLRGLARGDDAIALVEAVADLHPRNNTFPGEVFLQLAGFALDLAGVTADEPIAYDGLIEQYLPECRFRGRQNGKIQFAVLAAAARRGGVEADLLGEVIWWQTDDFWTYALFGAVALIRGCANRQDLSVEEFTDLLHQQLPT